MLDVTDPEPLPPDHPLLHLPTCVVTPHLAGSQGTELSPPGRAGVEEIHRFAAGEPPLHPVVAADIGRVA